MMDLGDAAKLESGIATVLASAKLISQAGARLLVLSDEITPARNAAAGAPPEVGNTLSWTEAEWKNVKVAVGQVIEKCRALGLRVAFHHHAGTHVETPQEVDRLFRCSLGPIWGCAWIRGTTFMAAAMCWLIWKSTFHGYGACI